MFLDSQMWAFFNRNYRQILTSGDELRIEPIFSSMFHSVGSRTTMHQCLSVEHKVSTSWHYSVSAIIILVLQQRPSRHTVVTAAQFGSHLLLRLHLNLYTTPLSFYHFLMQLYYADRSGYVLLFLNNKCTCCSMLFIQMLASVFTYYTSKTA